MGMTLQDASPCPRRGSPWPSRRRSTAPGRKLELVRLKFHEDLAHDMRTAHELVEVCATSIHSLFLLYDNFSLRSHCTAAKTSSLFSSLPCNHRNKILNRVFSSAECDRRPERPTKIWRPKTAEPQDCPDGKIRSKGSDVLAEPDAEIQSVLVLLPKPILALEFNSLQMHVDAPKNAVPRSKKKEVRYSST
ncbi:hypothetical protein GUJ93_ZPchr0010g9287 [Zizania palustris]|uniref:Uncharacterized protein n=1 Tax=Zizania palustris TaxID=103762 RepID=A0A8J6BQW1_ZIZPA|nr:hypothetical protein GUJ93_ZPchr0010g9287 [Zizania palustris]